MRISCNNTWLVLFFTIFLLIGKTVFDLSAQSPNLIFENFTIDEGLSNNLVYRVYQDRKGWMWFGTYQGLNRFDGYSFTTFNQNPADSTSLAGTMIRTIYEDREGRLWLGTEKRGIFLYNRNKDNFVSLSGVRNSFVLKAQTVNSIQEDKQGFLWLGTSNGLCKIDSTGKILELYNDVGIDESSIINNSLKVIYIDRDDKLWVGTVAGFDIVDLRTRKVVHLSVLNPALNDEICAIFCNKDGKIWIGTYTKGIVIVDPLTLKCEQLIIDRSNERSNTVRAIAMDENGRYWLGTRGGLYIYSKETKSYWQYEHDERESGSLVHNSIQDIFIDTKGDFWLGTRGGISYVVKEKQVFQCYKALPNDNHYMNNGETYAFYMDSSGKLWIGTETGGVNIFDRKNGTFTYITHTSQPNSLSNNCVKALMGDKQGNVWAGTYMGGINIIKPGTKQIIHYRNNPTVTSSLSNDIVWCLYTDSYNNIWVGTETGLDKFDAASHSFLHYKDVVWQQPVNWIKEDSNHDLWIGTYDELVIYNQITKKTKRFAEKSRMMFEDHNGKFWLTTLDKGLALYNKQKGALKYYTQSKGIANNQTYCILEDNSGFLWISTINGLSRFDTRKETFTNFNKVDGLQNNQFRYGACFKAPSGELIFGGITGFNIFNPADVKTNAYEPPIVFTGFKIFNKHVQVGNTSLLRNSITETQKIVLPYDQNVLTFEFAALNYAKSAKNRYAYKLDGFEKDWNDAGNQHSVTYTNLNPGEYNLIIKACNSDGVWNKANLELKIEIKPPIWKTWWFKCLILISLAAFLYLLFKFVFTRNLLKHQLIFERERARKLHELDMMKERFFTNVSHEIRTPLTLIASPLHKMLQTDMTAGEMKSYLSVMSRNTQQLLRLVNQLLDFRKIETGNLKLEMSKGDIVAFVNDIVTSFSHLAHDKNISLSFQTNENEIFTFFDADKLEKIMNNLLSNSFKFTPGGGKISVHLSVSQNEVENGNNKVIEIKVKDSGEGIPASNLQKIFNRFFQSANAKSQTGTGIGLALTKELVHLHKGRIFAESIPGKGSVFTVILPLDLKGEEEVIIADDLWSKDELKLPDQPEVHEGKTGEDKILLVVDDNADVRFFVRSHFEPDFKVLEAPDGKEGLSLALKHIPDIVISDVLMPVMGGNELCKKLKKDEKTSHIPVILLTALSSKNHKLEGAIVGADDYITKPFDIIFLKTKVENLLMLRNTLKQKYSGEMILGPRKITLDSPDERFLHKTIGVIEQNISDPEFDIVKLSVDVGVSRTQMYRKLAALTDMTVREFIKNIRLKRAAQLLEQNSLNVSEVAFAVGFKDLSHFRKCFRQEFGMSATEYNKKAGAGSEN
jgi:signal transduction histidine kinase/ligand-binding sensor domain-containing protein/DNA-binding response OmpR family regulator